MWMLKKRSWLNLAKVNVMHNNFEQINLFWTQWHKNEISEQQEGHQIYAKIKHNYLLSNKTSLFITMNEYYTSKGMDLKFLPKTYNVKSSHNMNDLKAFREMQGAPQGTIWIVKPGQNSNRGRGIRVFENQK